MKHSVNFKVVTLLCILVFEKRVELRYNNINFCLYQRNGNAKVCLIDQSIYISIHETLASKDAI